MLQSIPPENLETSWKKGIFRFERGKGGRSRGPPEGWQDLETELLLPLPAALPECVTQAQASGGRRNKRLLRQVVFGQIWVQGRNEVGTGLKPALGHLATPELIPARRCWVCRERPSRREREGKQLLPASGLVPGVVRRMRRRMSRRDPWARLVKVGAGQGGSLSPCPRSFAPGTGQGHRCQCPECAQGATEGRDKAHTHLGWGRSADSSRGTHSTVSVSQQQHRLSLASPDPDSG